MNCDEKNAKNNKEEKNAKNNKETGGTHKKSSQMQFSN